MFLYDNDYKFLFMVHLSAWSKMDSQKIVNLYNDKNSESNVITTIIIDDGDPPPKMGTSASEALNTIYN